MKKNIKMREHCPLKPMFQCCTGTGTHVFAKKIWNWVEQFFFFYGTYTGTQDYIVPPCTDTVSYDTVHVHMYTGTGYLPVPLVLVHYLRYRYSSVPFETIMDRPNLNNVKLPSNFQLPLVVTPKYLQSKLMLVSQTNSQTNQLQQQLPFCFVLGLSYTTANRTDTQALRPTVLDKVYLCQAGR